MTEVSIRRKKIYFRCWHRGTREMDLILGSFASQHLETSSLEDLDFFERLLSYADTEIYRLITNYNSDIPTNLQHPLFYALQKMATK